MKSNLIRVVFVVIFALVGFGLVGGLITACGGSGSGSTPTPITTTYTVSATAGTGTTITPASTTVNAGATATFTVGLLSGYQNLVAVGCTISGTTCTTGAINSNTTITLSATAIPVVNATLSVSITPGAVFDSDFATASVTIKVVATGSGFSFNAVPSQSLTSGYSPIPLSDTHTVANGGEVYSVTIVPGVSFPGLRYHGKTADFLGFFILAVDSTGNTVSNMGSYVELGIVSKSLQVSATQITGGVFVTSNAVNIVQAYTNPLNGVTIVGVTQEVYSLYPDVFDTIVVSNSRVDSFLAPSHTSFMPANSVLGIGFGAVGGDSSAPASNQDSFYGSSGKLNGLIGETPEDALQRAFLHEIGHTFAFYLNNPALNLTRKNNVHQNSLGTSVGWLGNNQYIAQQPDGDFLVVLKPDGTYSDLELYLMGLEPASAVPDGYFILSSDYVSQEIVGNILPAAAATSITISDIVGVYGQRSPTYTTSQKSFRVLFVWLSENTPTAAELAFHNDIATFYASSAAGEINNSVFPPLPYAFKAATKGNGTLVTAVPTK